MINNVTKRKLRHQRISKKMTSSKDSPRLVVFRSNKHIYGQIIDMVKSHTIASSSDLKIIGQDKSNSKSSKIDKSFQVGEILAKNAIHKKIKKVVFDRAGYKYHGRVKALAEGARKGGLDF